MKKINKKNKLISIKEKKGIKTTKRTRIYPNGNKYVGEFKDYQRHGQGTYTFADGKVFKQTWEDGEFLVKWKKLIKKIN